MPSAGKSVRKPMLLDNAGWNENAITISVTTMDWIHVSLLPPETAQKKKTW